MFDDPSAGPGFGMDSDPRRGGESERGYNPAMDSPPGSGMTESNTRPPIGAILLWLQPPCRHVKLTRRALCRPSWTCPPASPPALDRCA